MITISSQQAQYHRYQEAFDTQLLQTLKMDKKEKEAYVKALEAQLSSVVSRPDAVACNSSFSAYLLLFMMLNLKAGDEVIMTPLSSPSALQATLFMGAKVIFVDVNENNYTLDVTQLEDAITERSKIVVATSTYGHLCDFNTINALALKHDLCVVEDASQSLKAQQGTKHSGLLSKLAIISFEENALIEATNGGAALFFEDPELYTQAKQKRDLGLNEGALETIGIDAKISITDAVMITLQLEHLQQELQQRAKIYSDLQEDREESFNSAYLLLQNSDPDALISQAKEIDIEARKAFHTPLHLHPLMQQYDFHKDEFEVSHKVVQTTLQLPLSSYLNATTSTKIKTLIQTFS